MDKDKTDPRSAGSELEDNLQRPALPAEAFLHLILVDVLRPRLVEGAAVVDRDDLERRPVVDDEVLAPAAHSRCDLIVRTRQEGRDEGLVCLGVVGGLAERKQVRGLAGDHIRDRLHASLTLGKPRARQSQDDPASPDFAEFVESGSLPFTLCRLSAYLRRPATFRWGCETFRIRRKLRP